MIIILISMWRRKQVLKILKKSWGVFSSWVILNSLIPLSNLKSFGFLAHPNYYPQKTENKNEGNKNRCKDFRILLSYSKSKNAKNKIWLTGVTGLSNKTLAFQTNVGGGRIFTRTCIGQPDFTGQTRISPQYVALSQDVASTLSRCRNEIKI